MAEVIHISDAASIGLHTMMLLAVDRENRMSTREIAAVLNVSEAHLSKVLQRLTRQGLVNSVRGPKGGFYLSQAADGISLLTVYEAIDGPMQQTTCFLRVPVCEGYHCLFGDTLKEMYSTLRTRLANTTLAEAAATLGQWILQHQHVN